MKQEVTLPSTGKL